jgi:hypothetical protein
MATLPNKKRTKTKVSFHAKNREKKCTHTKNRRASTANRRHLLGTLIIISSFLLWIAGWRKTAIITAALGIVEILFGLDFAIGVPLYAAYSAFVIGIRLLHRTTGVAIAYT